MHSACLPQAPLHVTPKNWLCRSERNSTLDYMETTQTLPQIPDTKLHGDSKHNPSHVQQHTLPAQHPATRFHSNTNKPKLHESCSTKSKPYSMLQIKTFFVALLKKSFVIHLCCLKNIVLEKLTISQNAIR